MVSGYVAVAVHWPDDNLDVCVYPTTSDDHTLVCRETILASERGATDAATFLLRLLGWPVAGTWQRRGTGWTVPVTRTERASTAIVGRDGSMAPQGPGRDPAQRPGPRRRWAAGPGGSSPGS